VLRARQLDLLGRAYTVLKVRVSMPTAVLLFFVLFESVFTVYRAAAVLCFSFFLFSYHSLLSSNYSSLLLRAIINQLEAASMALGLDAAATKALATEAGWTSEDVDGGVFHVVPLPPKPIPFNGMFQCALKVHIALLLHWSVISSLHYFLPPPYSRA